MNSVSTMLQLLARRLYSWSNRRHWNGS